MKPWHFVGLVVCLLLKIGTSQYLDHCQQKFTKIELLLKSIKDKHQIGTLSKTANKSMKRLGDRRRYQFYDERFQTIMSDDVTDLYYLLQLDTIYGKLDLFPADERMNIARHRSLSHLLDELKSKSQTPFNGYFKPDLVIEKTSQSGDSCHIDGRLFANIDFSQSHAATTLVINEERIENPTFPFHTDVKIERGWLEIYNPNSKEVRKYALH